MLFDSFAGLCDALDVPGNVRERAVYKEKTDAGRNIRCVQVVSVQVVGANDRKIFIGKSCDFRKIWPQNAVTVLRQSSMEWSEGTWENGFEFISENFTERQDLSGAAHSKSGFVLTWEPSTDMYIPRDASPESIAGSLRVSFPAVVVRTRILTNSIHQIFFEPGTWFTFLNSRSVQQRSHAHDANNS